MSNTELKNSNECNNCIEEAIANNHFKYYEYKHFNNIQEIGSEGFGKVYRANLKNSHKYITLKSFFNVNSAIIKEVIHEIKLQRKVDFHNNVIRFCGITYPDQENQNDKIKNYLLVMEYADGGTLQNYLKEYFYKLTWNDKFNLALQLAYAVSCLHDEGIVHRDLHSRTVLVHQNTVKLADFGLSRRIEETSKSQSNIYGIIPYVDPKIFDEQRNENNPKQIYLLNEKSDVYSVGMILWEISNGKPPFYIEDEPYDIDLAVKISKGLRETIVLNTPMNYASLYTECWDNEPDNRPTMSQLVGKLKAIINQSTNDFPTVNYNVNLQLPREHSNINDLSYEELSQFLQNFNINAIEEINPLISSSNNKKEETFDMIVDEIVDIIFKLTNEGKEWKERKQAVIDYLNNHNINLEEIYNWLLNNQFNLNSIFLFGYFNYSYGIGVNENDEKAFNLFNKASEQNYILAQYYVGLCHQFGDGTVKNEKLAFEYYKKIADKDFVAGKFRIGSFYSEGIGIEKDANLAVYWYEKAASNGNLMAMHDLGLIYKNGDGVEKDHNKAFELFKKSAIEEYSSGITMLGYCYDIGIGTDVDKQKALELYQKAADLGDNIAQHNLALMYQDGNDIEKDYYKAFELFEKSAQGDYASGITMLGYCYNNGMGTDVNYQKALELYQKAANLGDNIAQHNLALMYEDGVGISQDIDQAIYWYKESAKQGNKGDQDNLDNLRIQFRCPPKIFLYKA